ncbi:MAG: hypothetical protein ABI622_06950 [Chloroflexota bacterium]
MKRGQLGYPLLAGVLLVLIVAGALGFMPVWLVAAAVYAIPGFLVIELDLGSDDVGRVERALLAVSLSMVLIIIGAQVLNLLPSGISGLSWIILLGGVSTVVAAVLVRVRQPGRSYPERSSLRPVERADGLELIGGAVLMLLALIVAVLGATVRTDPGFTQLSIERLSDTVNITVDSRELTHSRYRLVISTESDEHVLELAPGESWSLRIQAPDGAQRIEAQLFLGSETTPYREVSLEL